MVEVVFDEAAAERDKSRGERASRILNDPLVVEAFAEIDRAIVELFGSIKAEDKDALQELARVLDVTKRFKSVFETAISRGKLKAHDLVETKRRKLLGFR